MKESFHQARILRQTVHEPNRKRGKEEKHERNRYEAQSPGEDRQGLVMRLGGQKKLIRDGRGWSKDARRADRVEPE
eukprot:scaffold10764_cov159-Ochromonas_danica.AAC.40